MDTNQLKSLLERLYREQLENSSNEYLKYHASKQAICSKVNSFLGYKDFIPSTGRILDWGCQHGSDSCMVRATLPVKDVSLVGCDFLSPNHYPIFWSFSGIEFVQLNDPVKLPFHDSSFDCVIGGGVLEHTAMDYESLKEIYRILKPNGNLIITYLPNKYSYTEFFSREFMKRDFHRRLYTTSGISSMLKHTGFYPLMIRRHRFLPSNRFRAVTRIFSPYELLIDRVWPLNLFSGDILAISKKMEVF